jgi:hypothetical protein
LPSSTLIQGTTLTIWQQPLRIRTPLTNLQMINPTIKQLMMSLMT